MGDIKLVFPTLEYKDAAEKFKQEFFCCGESIINGSALFDQMEYAEWLENTLNNNNPQTVRSDWVVSSTFFAIRQTDGLIVGMVDIRHSIDHEFLSNYGGHIGYSVRPSERRRGYATDILRQALDFARHIDLPCVMLGCYSDNVASKKTIEKCDGKLSEVKPYIDGSMMNVYWIVL